MLINNRVLRKTGSTIVDYSIDLNDLFAGTRVLDMAATNDVLYIGSDLPFNHRHFELSVVNDQASVASVEIWDGQQWNSAVDVLDLTSSGGKSLAQSGIIAWTLDRNDSWEKEETTENISELSTLKIYNMYWVRITFSGALKGTTACKYVGHKFANDSALGGKYPDLVRSSVKSAFAAGKTDWNEQHILAAEEIIVWLRKENVIKSPSQIMGWEIFQDAGVHKVAEMILASQGEKREVDRETADKKFLAAMNQISFPQIDKDGDGRVDEEEAFASRAFIRV